MKKLLLIFVLSICNKGFTQNIFLKENELSKLLCKTWEFTEGYSNGKKIDGLNSIYYKYEFKDDKTYTINSSNSVHSNGNWNYNSENKCVELYIGENIPSGYIKSIDENNFILIVGKNAVPVQLNLEYHFKPQ